MSKYYGIILNLVLYYIISKIRTYLNLSFLIYIIPYPMYIQTRETNSIKKISENR
jgi:hypothetical protein